MGKRNLVYIEALRTFALLGVIFFNMAGIVMVHIHCNSCNIENDSNG